MLRDQRQHSHRDSPHPNRPGPTGQISQIQRRRAHITAERTQQCSTDIAATNEESIQPNVLACICCRMGERAHVRVAREALRVRRRKKRGRRGEIDEGTTP